MLSISVLVFSTGQKKLLKKTLKYVKKRVAFDGLSVKWVVSDDYVDHPRIDNEKTRSWIKELRIFEYCYFPDTNQGFGATINHLYQNVNTPYVLHLEHDWKFLKKVSLRPLLEIMEEHEEISCIRFNKKITKALPLVFWLDEPQRQRTFGRFILTQTKSWTTNPTVYRTAHIRQALPIRNLGSETSLKANMDARGFKSYSLGKPGEQYVKHLRGISAGQY
jgi:hypothetical protein